MNMAVARVCVYNILQEKPISNRVRKISLLINLDGAVLQMAWSDVQIILLRFAVGTTANPNSLT